MRSINIIYVFSSSSVFEYTQCPSDPSLSPSQNAKSSEHRHNSRSRSDHYLTLNCLIPCKLYNFLYSIGIVNHCSLMCRSKQSPHKVNILLILSNPPPLSLSLQCVCGVCVKYLYNRCINPHIQFHLLFLQSAIVSISTLFQWQIGIGPFHVNLFTWICDTSQNVHISNSFKLFMQYSYALNENLNKEILFLFTLLSHK